MISTERAEKYNVIIQLYNIYKSCSGSVSALREE